MSSGLSSISTPSFDDTPFQLQRTRSHNAESVQKADGVCTQEQEQRCWATMQPELLRYIMQKVDECRRTWPSRVDVFACASVCRSWREAMKDAVKCPEVSGRLCFPISVKQPGPRNSPIQCFVKRDRITSTFYLHLSSTASLTESGKFLLAARKIDRATCCEYIFSFSASDMSQGGETYVGKLRSNFLGTKFTIHESLSTECGRVASISHRSKRVWPKQCAYQSLSGTFDVAHISYELNVLRKRRPRRMQCTLYSVPISCLEGGRSVHSKGSSISFLRSQSTHTHNTRSELVDDTSKDFSISLLRSETTHNTESELVNDTGGGDAPLTLMNKAPRWHNSLQCWCLNFNGRVTIASVKNFQIIAATEYSQGNPPEVLLQFGKVGKDMYSMDYKYPLCAFQAFAICLSSFDTKGTSDGSAC